MAMFNRCIKESTGLWCPGILLVLILFCSLTSVVADGPQHRKHVGFRNRCVDMLLVDDDLRLPGIALPSDEKDRVRFLVRTQWLQENHPNFLETSIDPSVHAAATRFSKRVTEGLQAEIARLRKEPQPDIQQIGLLEEALVRMEPPSSEDGELIIVDIPRSQTKRLQTQIDNRRPIGLVGILLGVPECEEISWQDVRADLLQRPAGEVSEAMEQARRLLQPPIQNGENGDDLVRKTVDAILACIDIQSGRVCRIIERDGLYFAEAGPVDLSVISGQLMMGNVQKQLSELLGPEFGTPDLRTAQASQNSSHSLPMQAQQIARQQQAVTAIMTSFEVDIAAGSVIVRRSVYRNAGETWPLMFSVSRTAKSGETTQEQKDAIANDPRIQSLTGILGSIAGGQNMQTAIGLGAAIKSASDQAEQELQEAMMTVVSGKSASMPLSSIPTARIEQARPQ